MDLIAAHRRSLADALSTLTAEQWRGAVAVRRLDAGARPGPP